MKRVTVYSIGEATECVMGEAIEVMDRHARAVYRDGEPISPSLMVAPIQASEKILQLRVHQVVDETGGLVHIAMWPRLYELLRAPFKAEIESARIEARLSRESAEGWERLASQHLDAIDAWRGLSLWGRIKCAWTGQMPEVRRG